MITVYCAGINGDAYSAYSALKRHTNHTYISTLFSGLKEESNELLGACLGMADFIINAKRMIESGNHSYDLPDENGNSIILYDMILSGIVECASGYAQLMRRNAKTCPKAEDIKSSREKLVDMINQWAPVLNEVRIFASGVPLKPQPLEKLVLVKNKTRPITS
jgi:hypothetical protein